MTYIHNIKLEGDTPFIKAFNNASELFQKSQDVTLSEEERNEYLKLFLEERRRIEFGIY